MMYMDIGKGDVIVLLPGLGQNISAYDMQHELSDTYRLIIPDVNQCKTVDEAAWSIIDLLERLNIEKAHILGVSLGGVVVQLINKYDKSKVKSLILSNTFTYVPRYILRLAVRERESKLNSMTDEEYINEVVDNCIYKREYKDYAKSLFTINRDTYTSLMESVAEADLCDAIRDTRTPVLLMSGLFDLVTPTPCQWTQQMLINNSKLETFASGHLSNVECAEKYNRIIRNFISGIA